jgi:4-hydroxy-tetrahydrodipicolinate synthase
MERLDSVLGRVLIPLITPFREDGAVDYDTLADLANMVIDRGFCDSIIVGGTTGEFISLTFEERIKLLRVVRDAVGKRVPLVAGTGAAYTQHAIALTHEAEQLGYDVAMVVTPYYLKPNQEGIYQHFKAVAESTKLPILLYNIPLFTGSNIDPETLLALAKISNVKAIKEEAGINPTQASDYALVAPKDFVVYCGDDTMVLQVLTQGGVGVVSGGSMIIGDRMKQMIECYFSGNVIEAQKIHMQLYEFFHTFNQNGRVNPIPLVREVIGMTWRDVGAPRLPLLPATEPEKAELRRILVKMGVGIRELG